MDRDILEEHDTVDFDDALKSVDNFISHIDEIIQKKDLLYRIDIQKAQELVTTLSSTKIPNNYFSYKDFLREKLSQKFELEANDMVLFLDDGIYIKFFKQIENKNTAERRACGIEHDVLEEYKNEYFPNEIYKEEIFELLPCIVEDILNFRKIDPLSFKKIFVHALVNMVEIIVLNKMKTDDIVLIRGMSFYLLREVFDDVMLYIADDILFNFANADKKAGEFLSLFSVHEIIDKKGKRHKPNPILDENNHAWNMTTIRSTMIQHKKAKQAIYEKKEALANIKKKLEIYKLDQVKLTQEIEEKKKIEKELDKSLEKVQKSLEKIQNATTDKVKFIDGGVEKIFDRKPLIAKILKKEDDIFTEKNAIKREIENLETRVANKQKDIDIWSRKYQEGKELLKNIEKTGHPTDKVYDNIKKALAKTLAKR